MRGSPYDPDEDVAPAPSRRLTPASGLDTPSSEVPSDANEDFLFHLYRGSELLQDDRAHEAKEELERALHLQPHDTKGQDLLAVVYFRLGLFPRAIAILEQLRRKNPKDTAILLNLSLCYLKTGQPALARRDLDQLLALNPSHNRAWGYLGLACERLGDLKEAERAFTEGGHRAMARRMADRRAQQGSVVPPQEHAAAPPVVDSDARSAVATAFEELDAGELSFELAEQATPSETEQNDEAAQSWRPIELGQVRGRTAPAPLDGERRRETDKPDTRDGPPRIPAIPQLAAPAPASMSRRPTLIAPAAPQGSPDLGLWVHAPRPTFTLDDAGAPVVRHPVVAVPPARRDPLLSPPPQLAREGRVPTLPPPALPAAFPTTKSILLHASGVALVQVTAVAGFAARLESIRASGSGLAMKTLERTAKGKPTGEALGGAGSPIVDASGEGQLVLGPRPGRRIAPFALEDDMCFVREEILLGFDHGLTYENGRLSLGDGESAAIVQLRGRGAVLVESTSEILPLEVIPSRGINVRRESILGWFGRMVPRALPPDEAPGGQRGLIAFAGEGRVLVATA